MHVLSVHYLTIFFFFFLCFLNPLYVRFFRVTGTLITVGNFFFKSIFFFLIHKINLDRMCFDRCGRKSETNNIFFIPVYVPNAAVQETVSHIIAKVLSKRPFLIAGVKEMLACIGLSKLDEHIFFYCKVIYDSLVVFILFSIVKYLQ